MITLNPLELANIAVNGFGAMQKVPELAGLIDLVCSGAPKRIMEIGFGKGGTAWCWSKISSVEQLILLNLPEGPWGGGKDEDVVKMIAENTKARVDYIAGNSQNAEALEAVEARLYSSKFGTDHFSNIDGNGGGFRIPETSGLDFLFIDGDHSAHGVAADYELYKQFVRPGGIIAFHDVVPHPKESGCEVNLFWDKLKEGLDPEEYCEFIEESEGWAGIGVIKVPETIASVTGNDHPTH